MPRHIPAIGRISGTDSFCSAAASHRTIGVRRWWAAGWSAALARFRQLSRPDQRPNSCLRAAATVRTAIGATRG